MDSERMDTGEGTIENPGGPNVQDPEDNGVGDDTEFERVLEGANETDMDNDGMLNCVFLLNNVDLSTLEKLRRNDCLCLKIPKVNPMILSFCLKSGWSVRKEKGLMRALWEIFEKCAVWFLQKDSLTNHLQYADQLGDLQNF